jgi:ferritin-like metal-binding protein YciE
MPTDPRCAKLKAATQKRLETMTTKDHLARHDSQIARLEQVMTSLAEAQVKTDREMAKLARAMTALAESHAETEAVTRALSRQWQAYLNTLPKN